MLSIIVFWFWYEGKIDVIELYLYRFLITWFLHIRHVKTFPNKAIPILAKRREFMNSNLLHCLRNWSSLKENSKLVATNVCLALIYIVHIWWRLKSANFKPRLAGNTNLSNEKGWTNYYNTRRKKEDNRHTRLRTSGISNHRQAKKDFSNADTSRYLR